MEYRLDLTLTLCLTKTIGQLGTANSLHWNGQVLMRKDGHVLTKVLELKEEGQRKTGRLKVTWGREVEEKTHEDRLVKGLSA